ncbi:MAG: redoxin domain-containing protein [Rhodospirillaceae bacterium]|jgi:peroxiredoxin|nr:redoxin domain-containing protein [Rhodospirillaceae bacterium]MBT4589016.1 redoxin domain-containing protein [Rhodospirillaceae bacterium]MBT5941475.1 redoxin domain-containing protein [Rhodospirillaceae bacterium]MBT7265281.1 redoxin domain-containing protein [Rhodospirillaceae bacterium]
MTDSKKGNLPISQSRIRRDGLADGETAPSFDLATLDGSRMSLSSFGSSPLILIFTDLVNCSPCKNLLTTLREVHKLAPYIEIAIISNGAFEPNAKVAVEYELPFQVGLQSHWEVSTAYAMFRVPCAYFINADEKICGNVAVGVEQILNLFVGVAINSLLEAVGEMSPSMRPVSTAEGLKAS